MPKVTLKEIARHEGLVPSNVCFHHGQGYETCTRCNKVFFRCCIEYIMENRPGICGNCGARDYASELFRSYYEDDLQDRIPEEIEAEYTDDRLED